MDTVKSTWKETKEYQKDIQVKIVKDYVSGYSTGADGIEVPFPPVDVIQFDGPTKCEMYTIKSLLPFLKADLDALLCICAGTPNRWAECTVSRRDVFNFLKANGYE